MKYRTSGNRSKVGVALFHRQSLLSSFNEPFMYFFYFTVFDAVRSAQAALDHNLLLRHIVV